MPTLKNGKWKMPTDSSIRQWKNTSEFPDSWAKAAVEWLCEFYSVPAVSITIWDAKKRRGSGRAFLTMNRVHLSISRRNYRRDWKYWNIYWDVPRTADSACEAFLFLAAHEIAHISYEGKSVYRLCQQERSLPNKRDWRNRMECRIQDMAQSALDAYRAGAYRCLFAHHTSVIRREAAAKAAKTAKKQRAGTAEARVLALESRVEAWDAKKRRAENAMKKLRRSISGILTAQKRAALKAGGKPL